MNGNGSADGVELVGEENYSLSNNSHDPMESCQADGIDGPTARISHATDNADASEGER
jgi:hypothetical protein